jgi:hypothetical protein
MDGGVGPVKEGEVKEAKADRVMRRDEIRLAAEEGGQPFWEESDDMINPQGSDTG